MMLPLRHSHIAVRKKIWQLARPVAAKVSIGEDDLGRYRYFDLVISHANGGEQQCRFAAHFDDRMTHLLAERIDAVSDLAAAIFAVGVRSGSDVSISTDHEGRPIRSLGEIEDRLAAMILSEEPRRIGPGASMQGSLKVARIGTAHHHFEMTIAMQ